MNRKIIILWVLLFLGVFQVVNAKDVDVTIDTYDNGVCSKILPLGNTVNNNVLVFYTIGSQENQQLRVRLVKASGGLGPVQEIAAGHVEEWSAVWHPAANTYMLAYGRDSMVFARPVSRDGRPGKEVRIFESNIGSSPQQLAVAWAGKERFVVFSQSSGQLAAWALSKKGSVISGLGLLTSEKRGEVFPTAAATEKDGTAVAYCVHYRDEKSTARPLVVRVDAGAAVVGSFDLGFTGHANNRKSAMNVHGAYNPRSKTHAMAWLIGSKRVKVCTFKSDGTIVSAPVNSSHETIVRLVQHPRRKLFTMLFWDYSSITIVSALDFGISTFRSNGEVVAASKPLMSNITSFGTYDYCYSRDGSIFLGYLSGPGTVAGRLIK